MRQVTAVVDPPVHGDELLRTGFVFHARIVERGVEHDDGETEHVAGVGVREYVRVELAVALGETLHHAIDLLRLARQPEAPQELPANGEVTCRKVCAVFFMCNVSGYKGSSVSVCLYTHTHIIVIQK